MKARICKCGHWENWHVEAGCEVCVGYRKPQRCDVFEHGEWMDITGLVGRDRQPVGEG